jgi:hypothetical protein
MFLFTTPNAAEPARIPAAANRAVQNGPVVQAIRDGAEKTGTGFDFLLKTAQRESALDPNAKASTSSATGLFQFIEQTWLGMVKEQGSRHGLGAYADAIKDSDGGRLNVADPRLKQDILDLRRDPKLAAVMAGAFTQKNREALSGTIGREPTPGELYMAHVLGARGATDLVKANASAPQGPASDLFPDAAAANRPIFFDKAGKARPVSEVYAMLGAAHMQGAASASSVAGAAAATDAQGSTPAAQPFAALAPGRAKGLVGLFSSDGPRGPVSETVSRLWTTPRAPASRTAGLDDGQRFFPRAAGGIGLAGVPAPSPAAESAAPEIVNVPLPPVRPASFQSLAKAKGPLDLARFMNGWSRS